MSDRLTVIDLFAGCGGMTLGFVSTGRFRPVLAVEVDRDAAETYRTNLGDHVICGPIEEVDVLPPADVIVGGPPCQGFSTLNRNGVGAERRGLWREFLRALDLASPRAFVMENVPRLLGSAELTAFVEGARSLGYRVEGRVLDAADFGTPQRRRRAIVVGVGDDVDFDWPTPSHRDPAELTSDLTPWVTFRRAVERLPLEPDGVNWHRARSPRAESLVRYRAVPVDGGDRFQMQAALDEDGLGHLVPRCWRDKPTGTTDVFGRLWWDRPAVTIRTEFYKPEKGRYLHPAADRPLTIREGARLMGFPDEFTLPEKQSMTSVGRQVGNAVPPPLARAVAFSVAAALRRAPRALSAA